MTLPNYGRWSLTPDIINIIKIPTLANFPKHITGSYGWEIWQEYNLDILIRKGKWKIPLFIDDANF